MSTLTREAYFDAGLQLLGERGPNGVTLAAVCERVGATKGSFYHHFSSLGEMLDGTLERWVQSFALTEDVDLPSDAHARLTMLREMAVAANHETEVAIRAWAAWYPPAAEAHRAVEQRRVEILVATFVDIGIDESHATTLARVGTTLMAGVQSDIDKVDRSLLDELLSEYQRWIEASLPGDPQARRR